MRHTVVLSDIHLAQAEPGDGLWMRYRRKEVSPDPEIAAMLGELLHEVRGHELTLVLNGDIFDFDAPRVVGQESVFHDLPRDAANAVPMITSILDDHEPFVDAIGRVLAEGHSLVIISGNHDVQMTLPEVRAVVAERFLRAAERALTDAAELGAADRGGSARASIEQRIAFRAWFHKTDDGIVIEHGNQYDPFCAYRYPMAPFGRDAGTIQPTLGSLVTRLIASRMGYTNPHVDDSCMLSAWGYIAHWVKFYCFSRRSLAVAWATGAVRAVVELAHRRDPERRERRRANLAACARETGVPLKRVAKHARLFVPPAEDKLSFAIRELWLDRVALGTLCAIAALIWFLLAPGLLAGFAALAPSIMVVYELAVPKLSHMNAVWDRVESAARRVAKVHKAAAVVFGHTHRPKGSWEGGVFFGNTGSWSAAFKDLECTQPLFDERPLIWLASDAPGGQLRGGLAVWKTKEGRFELRETAKERATGVTPAWSAGVAEQAAKARLVSD